MVKALDGIDLRIRAGAYVAIMGPSGSGKSTLMNVLGCLDVPTSGRYLLAGEDVCRLDDDRLSAFRGRTIGFVFQSFNLLSRLTSLENVALPLQYSGVGKEEPKRRPGRLSTKSTPAKVETKPKKATGKDESSDRKVQTKKKRGAKGKQVEVAT